MKKIIAKIGYTPKKKKEDFEMYRTSLKYWLNKKIDFYPITHANFKDNMLLAVVEFNKDHCIYVLVEKEIFKKDRKDEIS